MRYRFVTAFMMATLSVVAFALPAVAQDLSRCIGGLRPDALKKGVSATTFDKAVRGVVGDPKLLELQDAQPEFVTPIWDYLATLVDDERIAEGRAVMRKWAPQLAAAEERFGVDRFVIAAVWGVETNFGQAKGTRPLIQSLATLSCTGRRQSAFRPELIATLQILERGDVRPDHLIGSWAGAFGHTQFMPTTFLKRAVDMDGDGRTDIVDSVPDALGSTANFLRAKGWDDDSTWGFEVAVPASLDPQKESRRQKRSMAEWAAAGIKLADGRALPREGAAGLITPAGVPGPAFLVTRNFDAVFAYNASTSYALAIVHLADRMRGGSPFLAAWPTDDPGLSRAERREMQTRLTARGYDVGVPDGAVGEKTRRAIADIQEKAGRPVDGRPSKFILEKLRETK